MEKQEDELSVSSTLAMAMGGTLTDEVLSPERRPTSPRKEEKEGVVSFASMPHLLQMVDTQVETGMYIMKRMRSFLQKFSDMQTKFALKLEEMAKQEKQKLLSNKTGPDKMETCWAAVVAFFGQIDSICVAYKELGENLTMTCVEPLNKFHGVCTQQQKEHHTEISRITGAYEEVKVDVHKNRENCRSLLQKLVQKRTQFNEGKGVTTDVKEIPKEPKSSRTGFAMFKNIMQNHTPKSKVTAKSLDKAREKAKAACEHYQVVVKKADQQQYHHFNSEIPSILKEMQKFEEIRLNQISTTLRKFSTLQDAFSQSTQTISEQLVLVGKTIDTDADLQNFIQKGLKDHGEASRPTPFVYDVAFTPDDLSPETFNETTKCLNLFSTTLGHVMKYQEKENPELKLDVPRILDSLLSGVIDPEKGGLQAEGIFRISVRGEDLAALRKQLEKGNYNLKGVDPYAAAALLKAWLRDLIEPVIPAELYDECITVGMGGISEHSSSTSSSSSSDQVGPLKSIMNRLPDLNRRVIQRLLALIRQITAPENVCKNKMTINNLAIVFAPCLLRGKSEDPLQLLKDSQYACNFVVLLARFELDLFEPDKLSLSGRGFV